MKKLILAAFIALCEIAGAENLVVYSVIGSAQKKEGSAWRKLNRREAIKGTDIIQVGENSALNIIDQENSKIYAIKHNAPSTVNAQIENIKKNKVSTTGLYVEHMTRALVNGSSGSVSHNAAGCTYRGATIENDMARTLAFKQANDALVQVSNGTSDYDVRFDVIDRTSDTTLNNVFIGKEAYFRIKNNSNTDLYINIIDINNDGELYDCLPIDEGMTQSHLLIPANSTIDLKDFPIAFSAPAGTDHLLLLAYPEPFDLRVINKLLLTPGLTSSQSCKMGIYNKKVGIVD